MTNWNWLTATGLVLVLSSCATAPAAAPETSPVTSAPSSVGSAAPAPSEGTVTKITDGDTVHVTSPDDVEVTVRIVAIDTPETKDPRKPVQCGGPEATAFASVTLLGRRVRLVVDPTQSATDRYGRTLAYIELVERNETTGAPADADYSTLTAEAGWGRAYIYDRAHPPQRIAQIQAAEARAHAASRGMWRLPCQLD